MLGKIRNLATGALRSRVAVFAAMALLHGAYAILTGPRLSSDSTTYIGWANNLVASNFDYSAVPGSGALLKPTIILRASFIYLIALLQLVAGDRWQVVFVALNIAANAAGAVLLTSLIWRVTASAMAVAVGLLSYALSYDIVQWTPFVLSDSIFLFLAVWIFAALVQIVRGSAGRSGWISLMAGLILALSFRPTGVVLLAVTVVAIPLGTLVRSRNPGRSRNSGLVLSVVVGLILGIMFTAAFFYQRPERWPVGLFERTVRTYSHDFSRGEVVHHRPETYHQPPGRLAEYVAISADRFIRFFQFYVGAFSKSHNLINVLFFVPVYFLSAIGMSAVLARNRDVAAAASVAIVGVLMFATFHSVTQLDFDWRYRIPALPYLFFLAALGGWMLEQRFASRRASLATG